MRSCVAGKSHRCKELISREACVRGVNIEAMLLVLRIFASPVSVSLPNAAGTHDRPALLFCLNVRPIIAYMPPLRANPSPYIRLPTGTPHPARAYTGMLGRFQLGIIGVAGMRIAPATPCDNGNKVSRCEILDHQPLFSALHDVQLARSVELRIVKLTMSTESCRALRLRLFKPEYNTQRWKRR
jgi:hypothetical protein